MRRPILLLTTIVLSLATAGVLMAAAWLLPPIHPVATSAAGEGIVRQFYDGVNTAIATGDLDSLRAVVAPNYVEIDPLPGTAPGRDGLEETLFNLHAAVPGLRLEVEAVVAAGDRAIARIAIRGEPGHAFLGFPIVAAPRPWAAVDVLSVRQGRIVTRRGLTEGTGSLRPIQTASLSLPPTDRHTVAVERVRLASGASRRVDATLDPVVVLTEAGTVRVAEDSGSPGEGTPGPDGRASWSPTVPPGSFAVIPAGGGATVANAGSASAAVWVVTFVPIRPSGAAALSGVGGEADDPAGLLPEGPLELVAGRVVLASGADLALAGIEGSTLLSVDAGRLRSVLDRPGLVRRGDDGSIAIVTSAELGPGDGILIDPGTSLALRNDDPTPATAWLLVITKASP
jgi:predicted ester cyclase